VNALAGDDESVWKGNANAQCDLENESVLPQVYWLLVYPRDFPWKAYVGRLLIRTIVRP
jgi:hypothetical protein